MMALLRRLSLALTIVWSLVLASPADLVLGHAPDASAAPPGPTVVYQGQLPSVTMTGAFNVVLLVLDWAPGAAIPAHTHSGPVLSLVTDGQVVHRAGGTQQTVGPGQGWIDPANEVHDVSNAGSANARTIAVHLQPVGTPLTTLQPGATSASPPPSPKITFQGQLPSVTMTGAFNVVLLVLDWAPGAAIPAHTHSGPVLSLVTDGQVVHRAGGTQQTVGPGQGWIDPANEVHDVSNAGSVNARTIAVHLQPVGTPLTTIIAQPSSLPRTGDPGWFGLVPWLVAGSVLAVVGRVVRRRRRA